MSRASIFKTAQSYFTPTSGKNESNRKYLGSRGNTGNVGERINSLSLT